MTNIFGGLTVTFKLNMMTFIENDMGQSYVLMVFSIEIIIKTSMSMIFKKI